MPSRPSLQQDARTAWILFQPSTPRDGSRSSWRRLSRRRKQALTGDESSEAPASNQGGGQQGSNPAPVTTDTASELPRPNNEGDRLGYFSQSESRTLHAIFWDEPEVLVEDLTHDREQNPILASTRSRSPIEIEDERSPK